MHEQIITTTIEDVKKVVSHLLDEKIAEVKNSILSEIKTNKLEAPEVFVKQNNERWEERLYNALLAVSGRKPEYLRQMTSADWVPPEFVAEVITKVGYENVYRRFARRVSVDSLSGQLPTLLGSATVYWVGEGAQITPSEPVKGVFNFTTNKQAVAIRVTNELLEGSPVDVATYLIDVVARAFADDERAQMTNGNGTGKPKGIRSETWTNNITWNGTNIYETLLSAFLAVDPQYRVRGVWLTSNKGLRLILNAKDTTGRPLVNPTLGEFPGTLFGRPIYEIPEIPENLGVGSDETEIYFGDFSNYAIIDYKGGRFEPQSSDQYMFLNDVIVFKFVKRLDAKFAYFEPGVNVVKITGVK